MEAQCRRVGLRTTATAKFAMSRASSRGAVHDFRHCGRVLGPKLETRRGLGEGLVGRGRICNRRSVMVVAAANGRPRKVIATVTTRPPTGFSAPTLAKEEERAERVDKLETEVQKLKQVKEEESSSSSSSSKEVARVEVSSNRLFKSVWRRAVRQVASLPLAIAELFARAGLSAVGTVIAQGERPSWYFENFPDSNPVLGFLSWQWVLGLGLDHVYTSPIYWVGQGILVTAVLSLVSLGTVLILDSYIWRVIRRPLVHCFLTGPFCTAAAASAFLGTIFVPLLKRLKTQQVFRIEGPAAHQSKVGTPTMGGLYFIPVGVAVARLATGVWSTELWGVCVATLAFAGIGFADDWLTLWRKHNYGMPGSLKFLLQVAVGVWFVLWLDSASLQSPYKMSRLLPLPSPFGLRFLGKWFLPLTAFCFAAMSNGVNLTDGLDGLAAGTCAAAYIGMAVAVLPIYPNLGVFGASMAGACIGFLTQNRYKARVFMGDTGSLALGGGLAAMAACTGMFLPLFIASGVFIIETVSVVIQVLFFKLTKRLEGKGRRLLRMSPFHHHLELTGWREPIIIAVAYVVAYILAIAAAYIGLISA